METFVNGKQIYSMSAMVFILYNLIVNTPDDRRLFYEVDRQYTHILAWSSVWILKASVSRIYLWYQGYTTPL